MVTELSNFCWGFSLKQGTVIIGVIQTILSFIFLILSAAYAEHPKELVDMSDLSDVPDLYTLRCVLILIAIASALQCAFSVFIIYGAETNRPRLLLPWLVFNPLAIAVYVLGTIVAIVHHTGISNTGFIVGHLIVGTSVSMIGGYNIATVYSLYKHLKTLNF